MTLVMMAWYTTKENFVGMGGFNFKDLYAEQLKEIDDDMLPFVYNDGINTEESGFFEAGDYWVHSETK
jgi:hypothetical protein